MESADKEDEGKPDAVLATMTNTSEDCEASTPAAKLLLVERGGGMLRRQLTEEKTKPDSTTKGGKDIPKFGSKSCKTMNHIN